MKAKITLLMSILFLAFNMSYAQEDTSEQDRISLSLLDQYVKAKNYDEAFKHFEELRNRNPKYSRAIYTNGEKIYKEHRIKNSAGAEKAENVIALVKVWEDRRMYFASKTPKGEFMAKSAQLLYDNNDVVKKSDKELYDLFDKAYKEDLATFTNPKSLYTYFKLAVKLYDTKQLSDEALFTKYDEVSEKVESEVKNYTSKLNSFRSEKGLTGEEGEEENLSRRDARTFRSFRSYLKNYDVISGGMDKDLGDRANCTNLIPLYERNYEENKNDGLWLQRAMNRLFNKECSESDLFVKIVEQKNKIEPNANTAYYLGILKDKAGDATGAEAFYNQAIDLETDNYEKAKILERLANGYKKDKKYSKARDYYRRALKENPSLGRAHYAIAQMYAASANNCGDTQFDKRATYWFAVQEARKASRIDPNLKSRVNKQIANWNGLAPSKSEIFSSGRSGETITFKCWFGGSVKIPDLK